jgi:hypothetical protein
VTYNPVFYAYAVVSENETLLFVDPVKVSKEVGQYLVDNNVVLKPYGEIFSFLAQLSSGENNVGFLIFSPYQTDFQSRKIFGSIQTMSILLFIDHLDLHPKLKSHLQFS